MPNKKTQTRRGGKAPTTRTRKHNKRNSGNRGAPTRGASAALSDMRRQVPLFPITVRKRLPYYEPSFSLTGTAGVYSQYVFTANGLYDPNITGTGHQPLGFDTMMAYYEQYTVVSSKITIRACGNGTQAVNVGMCLAPDTTTLVVPDVIENGLITATVLDGRANGGYGTGIRIKELNLHCDVARYFGRKRAGMLDDVNLYGTVAANPVEQVYFVIGQWGFGSFSDNTNVSLDAVIEYDAIFWEPRKVAAQLKRLPPEVKR